jgi:NTE family protein
MSRISRGFTGRRQPVADASRVPPGQYLTGDLPVLSAGPTPHTPLEDWSFTIGGAIGGIAFVFQGGGSVTAPQVGVLSALTEAGVMPDVAVGSSAGALNAVAFASDPSPEGLDELEAVWVSLRRRHVAPFSLRTLFAALTGRGDAFVSDTALPVLLERAALARTLRETSVPAHVVATDLATGAPVVLSNGDTMRALLASTAFPGLYRSVEVGRRLLVDGGVSADVPVLQAEAHGAKVSYVSPAATWDVAQPRPHRPLPQAYHALRQLLDAAARRDVAAAQRSVHVLPAPGTRIVNPIDFRDTARLIDEGYRPATDWLAINTTQTDTHPRPGRSPDLSATHVVGAIGDVHMGSRRPRRPVSALAPSIGHQPGRHGAIS